MTRRVSRNNTFTSGVNPSGFFRASVVAVNDNLLSVKIPRLGGENIYEDVPFTGLTPDVGDWVWATFIEGNSGLPIVVVGASDTTGDPSEADITEVIAGLGLSGGGDTGSVTVDFEPSELTTVELSYDDKIVISDNSDSGEPKLVSMSDVVVVSNGDGGGEPIGHAVRTDSTISFDYSTGIFTIAPVGDSYVVWCKGKKFVKTTSESVTIPNTTDLYYISFDEDGVLQYTTTFFVWDSETPTAYLYFNSTQPSKYMLFDERHGIVLDWQTHEYLHRTRGAAFANGFDIDFTGNNGSLPAPGDDPEDAQIDLDGGTFFDEDLQVDIVHSDSPTPDTWEQDLQGPAQIPVFYVGTSGGWGYDAPTDYPVKQGSSNPTYNLYSGGSWTTPDLGANQYGIYWIVATNNTNYPVMSIMGQAEYSNVGAAESVTWDSMILTDLPVVELRVLYKIVVRATGSNVPGCYFEQIDDFRTAVNAASAGTPVGDHGGLTGLGDDDHTQYLLADGSRAADTFTVTGSVGIGTTSPGYKLDVNGTGGFVGEITISEASPQIHFEATDSGADDFWIHVNSNNFYVLVDRDESGGWESPHPLQLEGDTNTAYTFGNRILTVADEGTGNGLDADTVDGVDASGFVSTTYNSSLNSDSRNSRGPTRLYRRDNDSDYSVQTYWTGSRWRLYGYLGDSGHADTHVGYADSAGNADTTDGLHVHSGTNNEANKIVRTQANGYIHAGWINTISGIHTGSITRITASDDAYLRYVTPAHFRSQVTDGVYLPLSGGTITGNLLVNGYIQTARTGGDPGLLVGDDAWIGDTDAANTIAFYGNTNNDQCTLQFGRYSGATIWGGSSTIDINNRLFVKNLLTTTGNNTLRYDGTSSEMLKFTSLRDKKDDITSIGGILDYLNEESPLHLLNPVIFHEKDQVLDTGEVFNSTRGEYVYGFIAEEVHEVLPESTFSDAEGNLVSYSNDSIVALLVAEVQRLTVLVHELYVQSNPDWAAPQARPAERSDAEKAIYDAKATELAAAVESQEEAPTE